MAAAALPSFASVDELAAWIGEPITTDSDVARAQGALRMASALVRRETGKTWVVPDSDPPALVDPLPDALVLVTLSCASRGYTNPRGITDASEGIDDYNYREQVKVDEAGYFLTASEKELLDPLAGRARGGLATIPTTRWAHDDDVWDGVINRPGWSGPTRERDYW